VFAVGVLAAALPLVLWGKDHAISGGSYDPCDGNECPCGPPFSGCTSPRDSSFATATRDARVSGGNLPGQCGPYLRDRAKSCYMIVGFLTEVSLEVIATEKFLTEQEVAKILNYNVRYLGQLRRRQVGPPYYKFVGKVVYSETELKNWVLACRVHNLELYRGKLPRLKTTYDGQSKA
jgi:hypothetical protein